MKIHFNISVLALVILTSGCVIGRRTVDINIPTSSSYPDSKKEIHVRSVIDKRVFENKPSDPSTPSIDGDVNELDETTKGIMIGRQRNTYGMAMGDIALPAGKSVVSLSKELVKESFKRHGFKIAENSSEHTVDVEVDQFWAWFTPGMWMISFESRVYFTLKITTSNSVNQVVIKGYGVNKGQVASNANWQLAYQRAFEDFLEKFSKEIENISI